MERPDAVWNPAHCAGCAMSRTRRSRPLPLREALSAGGVVYRVTRNGIEIALVVRDTPLIRALPKGGLMPGEELAQAASREVLEETGLEVELIAELGAIDYWFVARSEGARYHKTVHHFLFLAIGGNIDNHDNEYDRVEWSEIDAAIDTMSYDNEATMVRRAKELLSQLTSPPGSISKTAERLD